MRHKENTKLIGSCVILVPYDKTHVPKYHEWMKDEEILRLTGSDRLSLEEEFAMQQSWAEDEDKCTFIILDKQEYEVLKDDEKSMIGDVNLFLSTENRQEAEIEVMIAEPSARRKGCASEALKMMMEFGNSTLNIFNFIAKIKDDNLGSINLFRKLGFSEIGKNDVFHELVFQKQIQERN